MLSIVEPVRRGVYRRLNDSRLPIWVSKRENSRGNHTFYAKSHTISVLEARFSTNRNSRFLERPQKRSSGNQFIHRRLTRTKLIGKSQNPDIQADSQTSMMDGGWCLELRRDGRDGEEDESG